MMKERTLRVLEFIKILDMLASFAARPAKSLRRCLTLRR